MNGGITAANNSNAMATGSKKRKHGLAPKKTQLVESAPPENGFGKMPNDTVEEDADKGCTLCGDSKNHTLVDLRENLEMRNTIMSYLKVPTQNFDSVLSSVCVQCVYKINVHKDVTRQLKIRIQRIANRQANSATAKLSIMPTINNISANKSHKTCPEEKKQQPSSPIRNNRSERQTKITHNSKLGEKTIVPDENRSYTPPPVKVPANISPRNCMPTSTENSLALDESHDSETIEREVSPSPAYSPVQPPFSESNTTLPDSATKSPPTAVTLASLQVPDLEKVKKQSTSALKESHISLTVNNGTLRCTPSRSNSPLVSQNQSMLDVFYERPESALITESGGKINKYRAERIPPQQLVCQSCQRTYWRKDYYTKHVRRCRSRPKSVALSLKSNDFEEIASKKRVFHCNECPVTVDSMAKLRDHKHIHLQRFYCEACGLESMARQNHEFHRVECLAKQEALNSSVVQNEVPEKAQIRVTRSRSRAASRAATRVVNSRLSDEYSNFSNDEDLDQCDFESVTDTMYTKRMRYTDNWVEDHSNSASYMSHCDNTFDFDDDLQISSYKEYDLYLLDRLKMEIHMNCLSCFVPNCEFRTDNLPRLMLHDYLDHLKKLWFHCKKCSCSFTSKVHLDYHLACQNGGRFICFKCGDIFEFQHQLDRHLMCHTKSVNYRCNYCNFEFLTEVELLQHCEIEQHDPNGERKLISIDPSMTIVNSIPPASPTTYRGNRCYKVKIMEMHLPPMPSNRPRPRPGHKPYRLRVGDVLFKNQKNPNCWGWK